MYVRYLIVLHSPLKMPSSDMSPQQDIFNHAIERFTAEEEEVRTAAAFAAGNIAVGNLHHFLPLIVRMVEHDQEKRLLSLHAIKEVSRRRSRRS